MAYNGTLVTLGGTKFPSRWIYADSYSVTPHTLDLDSTRNTNGKLQRNVLNHKSVTVSFQTKPMSLTEYEEVWAFIRSKYTDAKAKKVRLGYYNFETGEIEVTDAYIPDVEHNPYWIKNSKGTMNGSTIEFIGY